jgi:hypothetical protein
LRELPRGYPLPSPTESILLGRAHSTQNVCISLVKRKVQAGGRNFTDADATFLMRSWKSLGMLKTTQSPQREKASRGKFLGKLRQAFTPLSRDKNICTTSCPTRAKVSITSPPGGGDPSASASIISRLTLLSRSIYSGEEMIMITIKRGFELAHLPSTSGREKRERRKLSYTSCPEINREISSLVFAGVHRASTSGLPIRFCAKPQRPVPT